MLVRLMYASRATAALTDGDLAAILKTSREHNPAEGITGRRTCRVSPIWDGSASRP